MKNKYGLSRKIPPKTKKQIRKEAGYSCVVCGSCPYDYEHIEPEFKDAEFHDPTKMTILCALCHRKVTNKVFSKEKIWAAKKEPWALKNGHTKYGLDFFGDTFTFILGNWEIEDAEFPLTINGVPILSMNYCKIEKILKINGIFYHGNTEIGRIKNNEWQGLVSDADTEIVSNRITVKLEDRKIFELELFPPNKIVISEMTINIDNNLAMIQTDSNGEKWFILIGDTRISDSLFFADKEKYKVKGLHSLELKGAARLIEKLGQRIEFIQCK